MIKDIFDPGENLIWEGKPDRVAYIIGSPLQYPLMLIMMGFFLTILYLTRSLQNPSAGFKHELVIGALFILYGFVYLPIYRTIHWKYMQYAITDKRVYLASGIIGRDIKVVDYTAISSLYVNVDFIDKIRNCGSVRLTTKAAVDSTNDSRVRATLLHIPDAYNVYKMIKQLSLDIKSDIYYPNALRPEENQGYNTKYTPKQ